MVPGSSKPMAEKLNKYAVDPATGCWVWQGANDRDGYGRIGGSAYGVPWFKFAHRASYEEFVGPIPEGLHVLHHCDNPPCINPDLLYTGTPLDNGRDKAARGRSRTSPEAISAANLRNPQPRCPLTGQFVPSNTGPRSAMAGGGLHEDLYCRPFHF